MLLESIVELEVWCYWLLIGGITKQLRTHQITGVKVLALKRNQGDSIVSSLTNFVFPEHCIGITVYPVCTVYPEKMDLLNLLFYTILSLSE